MKELYVGHCLICKQGMLEIVKEIKTGICFICCDECEAEWDNPENALGAWDKSPRRYIGKLKMERIHRKYA